MNPDIFWNAFGAIGTTAGAIATAVAVWVSLKPYQRKIGASYSTKIFAGDVKENSIYIVNTGHSIFVEMLTIYNRSGTIFSYPIEPPVLIATDNMHEFSVDDEDADALRYHVRQHPKKQVFISIREVHGNRYKLKLDGDWLNMSLDGTEAIVTDL